MKKKPKPFELMPGPPPTAPAPPAEPERKPIMSADLDRRTEAPRLSPPVRGPQAGEASMDDAAFVAAFGMPAEFKTWRAQIIERRARDQASWVFFRCDHCGLVVKDKAGSADAEPCLKCNRGTPASAGGGHLRLMTDREANEFLFRQAADDKAYEERARRRRFHERNQERAQRGIEPLSQQEFERLEAREREERREQERKLRAIPGPRARRTA